MNVLIVDDTPINHTIYQNVLRKTGDVTFKSFTSSAEALEWVSKNDADLAIVDYNMPTPNGLEFIAAFRALENTRHTSVLMVTAELERDIRYQALQIGANDFLVKPVDPTELAARARNMLMLADAQKKLSDHATWLYGEVQRATANIRERERETITRLTRAAEFRDNETGMHIVRMGHFCAIIGRRLGLSSEDADILLLAAPMHDIGKVSTPDNILLKPGKLNPAEWEIMKQHTVAGYDILNGSKSTLLQHAADIAIGHHEKFDGSGYPYGKKGEAIPLFARICAVSDVFDALTSIRPYKSAWTVADAVGYIGDHAKTQFDPAIVAAFQQAIPEIVEAKALYSDATPALPQNLAHAAAPNRANGAAPG